MSSWGPYLQSSSVLRTIRRQQKEPRGALRALEGQTRRARRQSGQHITQTTWPLHVWLCVTHIHANVRTFLASLTRI
eukprot:9480197-Pyramimonas_sp.AAC.1